MSLEDMMEARRSMERVNRAISRAVEAKGLEDPNEINAFLRRLEDMHFDEILSEYGEESPEDQALDLALQAMSSSDPDEIRELTQRALELDPACIDARITDVAITAESLEEVIDKTREVIAEAEQNFGEAYFEENRGHFWGLVETRPYMRALFFLGSRLQDAGRLEEAAQTYAKILELNPGDNQGARYPLLGLYLATQDFRGAQRLFDQYDEDSAVFLWGRMIERHMTGDLKGAQKAFKAAIRQNPHVLQALVDRKSVQDESGASYSPGEPSEAAMCLDMLAPAFLANEDVLGWLLQQTL